MCTQAAPCRQPCAAPSARRQAPHCIAQLLQLAAAHSRSHASHSPQLHASATEGAAQAAAHPIHASTTEGTQAAAPHPIHAAQQQHTAPPGPLLAAAPGSR